MKDQQAELYNCFVTNSKLTNNSFLEITGSVLGGWPIAYTYWWKAVDQLKLTG
jgi:hypothetical protein